MAKATATATATVSTQDAGILDSIKKMLRSKIADDQKIAATLFFEHYGNFDPARDLNFMQDIIIDEEISDPSYQVFAESLATLILEKREAEKTK